MVAFDLSFVAVAHLPQRCTPIPQSKLNNKRILLAVCHSHLWSLTLS